eukprot:CCRYP_002696-RA/>CCRYP_002696-RA protein AED:0.46 eAED:0.38 QI:0/-1/0/1/-1/0/1/0/15
MLWGQQITVYTNHKI